MEEHITKIFFQTSRDKLDKYYIDMIQSKLTDGWNYIHYTDSEIIQFFTEHLDSEFPNIIERFNTIKRGEHKSELFRYYHLYIKGGVYMDSDAMIYEPIDMIVKDYRFISVNSTNIPNTIFQGIIGSEKKNPLIFTMLKDLYLIDLNILNINYFHTCNKIFNELGLIENKEKYVLYNEVPCYSGDKIVDSNNVLLFRHYWRCKDRKPNLVYMCVFYNRDYIKLLDLLLKSLKFYCNNINFDILILTIPDFESEIYNICNTLGIHVLVYTINSTTIFQAACARLSIFDYDYITAYKKILYLDTDIIIKGELAPIFNLPLNDVLYGLECGTINSPSFGNQFFNFSKIDGSTTGINSGTLLFKNSQKMRDLFSRIRKHVDEFTESGQKIPYCMDQPFINYHAIKDGLYDNKVLNQYISLYEGNDTVNNYETSSICHFSYPIGNFGHKYKRMAAFLSKLLSTETNTNLVLDVYEQYFTFSIGYIKLTKEHLETSWGKGIYKFLNQYTISATWNGYEHILKFNKDYTKYDCIRTYPCDFNFINGSLLRSNINIYGDSHAMLAFNNFTTNHRNLFEYAITMHRIGRDNFIYNFHPSHNNSNTIFCLVYGDVDVRCHIGKQVLLGRDETTICSELVVQYFKAIQSTIRQYKAIIIVGISPPVDSNDHTHSNHVPFIVPFIGTNEERVRYTEIMNKLLKEYCIKYRYIYFNPYDFYRREDGCLKYELSDNCLHIGDNKHFLGQFNALMYSI